MTSSPLGESIKQTYDSQSLTDSSQSASKKQPQGVLKRGYIPITDVDPSQLEGQKFVGEWNEKTYVVTKIHSDKPLGSGANGTAYKVDVLVLKFNEDGELYAVKPKTLVGKVNLQDKHTQGETATLQVLHEGEQTTGIPVWIGTVLLTDSTSHSTIPKEMRMIMTKFYTTGDLRKVINSRGFQNDIKHRELGTALMLTPLLYGFSRVVETGVAYIDIKPENVFTREVAPQKGFIDAVLADMGKSPPVPTEINYDNLESFRQFDLVVTPHYSGLAIPASLKKTARQAGNIALESQKLHQEGLELEKAGRPEEAATKLQAAKERLAEAQVLVDRFHLLLQTLQKNLFATLICESLLDIKPFVREGMPQGFLVEPFKENLGELLREKGLDPRWEEIINFFLTEIPYGESLDHYLKTGETSVEVPPEVRGELPPKTVTIISGVNFEALDGIMDLATQLRQNLYNQSLQKKATERTRSQLVNLEIDKGMPPTPDSAIEMTPKTNTP